MNIDNEYMFNNKICDVSVRNIKANFFDILSIDSNLVDSSMKQEYLNKLDQLKSNMSNIIELIEDLDNNYFNKDNNIFSKQFSNDLVDVQPDKIEQNPNVDDSIKDESIDLDNNINEIDTDQIIDMDVSNDVNDISNSIVTFHKDNDDIVKAILVSDQQYDKLLKSQNQQIDEVHNLDVKETSIVNNDASSTIDNSMSMTDMAIKLYKEGKTKEAQEIMDKITKHND